MTPPHIKLYILVVEKNARSGREIYPFRGECKRRGMSGIHTSTEDYYEPGLYEIRIRGHLADRWATWFGNMTIALQENGDTLLTGPVIDQAALHALLRKVRDIGMILLSVRALEPSQVDVPGVKQQD